VPRRRSGSRSGRTATGAHGSGPSPVRDPRVRQSPRVSPTWRTLEALADSARTMLQSPPSARVRVLLGGRSLQSPPSQGTVGTWRTCRAPSTRLRAERPLPAPASPVSQRVPRNASGRFRRVLQRSPATRRSRTPTPLPSGRRSKPWSARRRPQGAPVEGTRKGAGLFGDLTRTAGRTPRGPPLPGPSGAVGGEVSSSQA